MRVSLMAVEQTLSTLAYYTIAIDHFVCWEDVVECRARHSHQTVWGNNTGDIIRAESDTLRILKELSDETGEKGGAVFISPEGYHYIAILDYVCVKLCAATLDSLGPADCTKLADAIMRDIQSITHYSPDSLKARGAQSLADYKKQQSITRPYQWAAA